ncbi:MAG TPA: LUD domain-containing protein [archaeon]|nr:LUD domain-containing protein [archaeon]
MKDWSKPAPPEAIERAAKALTANGMRAIIVPDGSAAKQKLLELLPQGAEVMNMTSVTLDAIGASQAVLEGGYDPVRKKLESADERKKRWLGAAPEYAIGSVHAVTEDGKVFVASATGSQLPAYAYASKVIWVVGGQKVVKDAEQAMDRIFTYVLPLEDQRARKAYGVGSGVNKLLAFNKEVAEGRITMILVRDEALGF